MEAVPETCVYRVLYVLDELIQRSLSYTQNFDSLIFFF